MKRFKVLLGAAVASLVIVCALGMFHRSTWRVEKSRSMRAQPATIFAHIDTAAHWQEWMSWGHKQEAPALTLSGGDPAKGVEYALTIAEEDLSAHGSLRFTVDGDATRVSWVETGDVGWDPVTRLFVGILETARGRVVEKGLNLLQAKLEGGR